MRLSPAISAFPGPCFGLKVFPLSPDGAIAGPPEKGRIFLEGLPDDVPEMSRLSSEAKSYHSRFHAYRTQDGQDHFFMVVPETPLEVEKLEIINNQGYTAMWAFLVQFLPCEVVKNLDVLA